IFAPQTNAVGLPYDSFTFVAEDTEFASPPATVTINIVPPNAPVIEVARSVWSTNGYFQLSFTGQVNAAYRVWTSTNLVDWTVLGSASSSSGRFTFRDYSATNFSWRFYRAGAP
ncbi:MAG TPA: hypothetical protein VNT99_04040, partial [Methylomirabilota bacterium]|nr:hypothetical protein [Methylomirabilota bacterium]